MAQFRDRLNFGRQPRSPNTIIAELEGVYFRALQCVDRMEDRNRRNLAGGKFTAEGMKADARQFALNHLLPVLHCGRYSISKGKTELAERKAKLASGHDGEIDELQEDIAAAESALDAACEEIRVETDA